MLIIKKGKSCGCLIASNIIALEIQRKKHNLKIKELRKKLVKARSKQYITNLKRKHKELDNYIKRINKNQKDMRTRFRTYVKNSGYVSPKLKNKRW